MQKRNRLVASVSISVAIIIFAVLYLETPIRFLDIGNAQENISKDKERENWRAERRKYLENMKAPEMSWKEVAKLLKERKLIKDKEFYDIVDYYVYNGSRDVIEQVILNKEYELKETIKKGRIPKDNFTSVTIVGAGFYPGPAWGTDKERLILHEVIHKCARKEKVYPRYIYRLLLCIRTKNFKTESYKIYWNQLLFYDEIKALLRLYAKYKEYPVIRNLCRRTIVEYPCVWRDFHTIDEALEIADSKGPEVAYSFFMERYKRNYCSIRGVLVDPNHVKGYDYEGVFEGWTSEGIKGEIKIHDVNSDDAKVLLRNVREVYSIHRDGKDIKNLYQIIKQGVYENSLEIPLKKGDPVVIELEIDVSPIWWRHYIWLYP